MKYLLGYRNSEVKLYKTEIKPLGRVVAGVGVIFFIIGAIPNGLGVLAFPISFFCLGSVGIEISSYKKLLIRKLNWLKVRYL